MTEDFETVYRRHVDNVVSGDNRSVLADMTPENVPAVFEDVTLPGPDVLSAQVLTVGEDGARRIGEAVYQTPNGAVRLRSTWIERDGRWLAAELENIPEQAQ